MTQKDIIGTQVAQMHNGKVRIGTIKDLLKNENGCEYLNVQFDSDNTVLFPFPDIIAPKYNMRFRFVDENVKNYVEQLFVEKHKAAKQAGQKNAAESVYVQTSKPRTNLTVKENQSFYYDTHAELLNTLLHLNLGAWFRSARILDSHNAIWMISLDNSPRNGWKNRRQGDFIYEHYIYTPIPIDPLNGRNRLCFSIHYDHKRYYVFEGVYKCIRTENNTRIWQKISDSYTF